MCKEHSLSVKGFLIWLFLMNNLITIAWRHFIFQEQNAISEIIHGYQDPFQNYRLSLIYYISVNTLFQIE